MAGDCEQKATFPPGADSSHSERTLNSGGKPAVHRGRHHLPAGWVWGPSVEKSLNLSIRLGNEDIFSALMLGIKFDFRQIYEALLVAVDTNRRRWSKGSWTASTSRRATRWTWAPSPWQYLTITLMTPSLPLAWPRWSWLVRRTCMTSSPSWLRRAMPSLCLTPSPVPVWSAGTAVSMTRWSSLSLVSTPTRAWPAGHTSPSPHKMPCSVPWNSVGRYASCPRKSLNVRYELFDVVCKWQHSTIFIYCILPGKLTENTFSFTAMTGNVM